MHFSDATRNVLRSVFKALVIYTAGAWALIEVVDFAVEKYGLNRLVLDISVLAAFGGGLITAVIAWFHSEPYRQHGTRTETLIVATLVLSITAGVIPGSTRTQR
jgi:hypothetical protein